MELLFWSAKIIKDFWIVRRKLASGRISKFPFTDYLLVLHQNQSNNHESGRTLCQKIVSI